MIQNFHREAAARLLQAGALRLHALRFETQIIAVFNGFQTATRLFYYLGGFDPEFARFSPGALLIGDAIERAVAEVDREFDRGPERYKYNSGARDRTNYRRRFWIAQT